MPTSRSVKRGIDPPAGAVAGSNLLRPLILIGALAVLTVTIVVLPASMVRRFLPAAIGAQDFSGSVWHGSAGAVTLDALPVGAIEWHLHPGALLRLAAVADVHWVKGAFVADGTVDFTSRGLDLLRVSGGGPIDDLYAFGVPAGWNGTTSVKFSEIKLTFGSGAAGGGLGGLESVNGDVDVMNLSSARVAGGADLGGYTLHLANAAITPGADATATLNDTGGPLEVNATVQLSPDGRTGMLSGSIKARADAPPALLRQLDNLAQLHARDAYGAIPVELEFTL